MNIFHFGQKWCAKNKAWFKGKTSDGRKAVIILGDNAGDDATIVFKSKSSCGCTRFSVDLYGDGQAECLKSAPHPPMGGNEDEVMAGNDRMIRDYIMPEDRTSVMERTPDEIAASPRALDPNGYKLKVMFLFLRLLGFQVC